MTGSSFGRLLRVTTAGESHGPAIVAIVDGVPPGLEIEVEFLRAELARRRPGQSGLVSKRAEPDEPEILSGVFDGRSTGTPIAVLVRNRDARSKDYEALRDVYRPGHADYPYDAKYGFRDWRGSGRASARETVARVAAGAIAKILLARFGARVTGWVDQVGEVRAEIDDPAAVRAQDVEATPVRCPDAAAAERMIERIEAVRRDRDSVGGAATICATGVPPGWGEPVFDKLKADLGKALLSLPAVLGVEYGAGFAAATMRGSESRDAFVLDKGRVTTRTNRHGGMLGGLSSGLPIVLRAVVKPTSSIPREIETVTRGGQATTVAVHGRHDPCLLPRFVPMAEAMVALVLADHALVHNARRLP